MKGYKGFNKDLTCRGKQYAENTVFEEETAEICKSGMHFCKNPFEVLNYYPFVNDNAEINEFAEVEALDECKTDDNEKFTTKKLKIGAKIGIDGLIKAFINFTLSKAKAESAATNIGDCSVATNTGVCSVATNTGNYSVATNTGNKSVATNTGDKSVATNTGDKSVATNTGDYSAATNTGDCSVATNTGVCSVATNTGNYSVATNTGNKSVATNTGDKSVATNTGDKSVATNTGDYSAATNTGDYSAASVEGKSSFAIATGINSKAKGKLGCYIAVAEWGQKDDGEYELINFKSHKVDGKTIKEDTYYTLKNGKFVEVKTNEAI